MPLLSRNIDQVVDQFAQLPGVGKRTALRYVLHLLKHNFQEIDQFASALKELKDSIQFCSCCFNYSDTEVCEICSNPGRSTDVICVVEDIRDVIAIENTTQFKGLYHVLGGLISPMDGIGPDDLKIMELKSRISESTAEIIFALSATMEGDATNFYIYKVLNNKSIKYSTLSRGVAVGGELEYADEVTLGRSITNRTPYEFLG